MVTILQMKPVPIFVVKLTHGCLCLVHPVADEQKRRFIPCTYGYAMTTRKAQGASLDHVVLWFDLFMPANRGFAYVGASRVRRATGLYYYGKIRRTDWLPVDGPGPPIEQVKRSTESMSEDEADDIDSEDEFLLTNSEGSPLGEDLSDAMSVDAEAIDDEPFFAASGADEFLVPYSEGSVCEEDSSDAMSVDGEVPGEVDYDDDPFLAFSGAGIDCDEEENPFFGLSDHGVESVEANPFKQLGSSEGHAIGQVDYEEDNPLSFMGMEHEVESFFMEVVDPVYDSLTIRTPVDVVSQLASLGVEAIV